MNRCIATVVLPTLLLATSALAQVASPPEILGVLAGPGSDPAQPQLAFHGTDLGWTVEHDGELQILFGDTNETFDAVCFGQLHNDDTQGTIPLERPDGVPPLSMQTEPGDPTALERLEVFRDGESLQMGYGQVPVGAYSDGRDLVAIVGRGGTVHCNAGASHPVAACRGSLSDHPDFFSWLTADGLRCTQALGECSPPPNGIPTACELATGRGCNALLGQVCLPTDTGLCVDPSSSQNDGTPASEVYTVAHEMEFAVQDPSERGRYESMATLRSNKFINPSARTVKRFTGLPFGNDYRPGKGALLVWGRPFFNAEEGRQSQLYLMVHPLPVRRAHDGEWRFRPWYFAGVTRSGLPLWSRVQGRAKPLALDGEIGGSPFEEQPLVNQFSVSWVGGSIRKWVMLYSGNTADYLILDPANARPGPEPGSVRIRYADHPWGPWSPPQPHLLEGLPDQIGAAVGPGGVLFHPACQDAPGAPCAESDPVRPIDSFLPGCPPVGRTFDRGFFYGANIIDAYTEADGSGGMNLYWNLSTWNPYAVLYLKTNLKPGP